MICAKKEWEVRIVLNETEGENTTKPWYTSRDIEALIRCFLNEQSSMRDLKIQSITASTDDRAYY